MFQKLWRRLHHCIVGCNKDITHACLGYGAITVYQIEKVGPGRSLLELFPFHANKHELS